MKDQEFSEMSFDEWDEFHRPPPATTDFDRIVDEAISRRGFIGGIVSVGAGAFVLGTSALSPTSAVANASRLGFEAVAANTDDDITLPPGYNHQVVVRWGDPLFSNGAPFDHATRGTAESQERACGDNTDGMAVFTYNGRTVIANNNEYTNLGVIHGNNESARPESDDDIWKNMMAQGVSVLEVAESEGTWEVVTDSPYNRRITPQTDMDITGPAAGHDWMKTGADPTGTTCKGTWNNCGNGETPWGTYLACEENFNGYFSSTDENFKRTDGMKRYGVNLEDRGYGWAKVDNRFDLPTEPNECNRFGWVVEIDPSDASSTPKKRTALGRFKHENADVVVNGDGKIVVYMGDDERGEFLYRFISDGYYAEGGDNADLLAEGSLYVAKFHPDGTGRWLELTPEATGMASQAEVVIHARMAASAVGATTMDRPEWVASNPTKPEVYVALTNNRNRGVKPNAGGDPTPAMGPNPREVNNYGQIARWWPAGGDHTADAFTWDLFALAGNPDVHEDAYGGSANINSANMFNSPDGLIFDSKGLIWIQTDGNYSNEEDFAGMGNNQMLVGDPATGEIRRFLVGPKECEVTGAAFSADRRTMFVGIQHPGERGDSHWPEGGDAVPRSAIIAVRRDDGGLIG